MKKRRVAITGVGVVSPLGNDAQSTWSNLLAGQSGIANIQQFDASAFPTYIAAEVKNFTPAPALATKNNRYAMPLTHFALDAAVQAFDDAGIAPTAQSAARWGVVTGSGMMTAEFEYLQRFQRACAPEGEVSWAQLQAVSQDFNRLVDFGKTTSNTGLSLLIQQFGIQYDKKQSAGK